MNRWRGWWTGWMVLVCGWVFTGCAGHRTPGFEMHEAGDRSSRQAFGNFWVEFQETVKSGDPDRVATLTAWPMTKCDIPSVFGNVSDPAGFRRAFKSLFPAECRVTILVTSATQVAHEEGKPGEADGEGWSIAHNHRSEISEGEWSIIYEFARTRDGIRLVGIQFAG